MQGVTAAYLGLEILISLLKKKGEMKKLLLVIPLVILLCFIFSCQVKKAKVERFMEDGVEVVLNFAISQNKSVNPVLNQILSIDTENEDLVEFGLNDIYGFDVSSSGKAGSSAANLA